MPASAGPNRYSHTPRRVFEKSIEKLERKIALLNDEIRVLERNLKRLDAAQRSLLDFLKPIEETPNQDPQQEEDDLQKQLDLAEAGYTWEERRSKHA